MSAEYIGMIADILTIIFLIGFAAFTIAGNRRPVAPKPSKASQDLLAHLEKVRMRLDRADALYDEYEKARKGSK